MRVFMCEFETGGGVRRENLPPALLREGAMMRDALARDLADVAGVELLTTHDDRLAPPAHGTSVPVGEATDVWALWADRAASADVAWVIAPEYGGALSRLTSLVRASGAIVVGPNDEAIRVASSKALTGERLAAHGVPTPSVWRPGAVPDDASGPFVTKPDDGAGCEFIHLVETPLHSNAAPASHVVQRFVAGTPASLSVLVADDATRVLTANRQNVVLQDGAFSFRGVSVAAFDHRDLALVELAERVVRALPGLAGIFGIDFVISADGPVVIEVNPRITTAYAGLRQALGLNPVSLVPPFAARLAACPGASRPVEVAL